MVVLCYILFKDQKLESHEGGVAYESMDGRMCEPTHDYSLNAGCSLSSRSCVVDLVTGVANQCGEVGTLRSC